MEQPRASQFVVAVTAVLAALSAGCLVKETRSSAYLEASGSVTWTIMEADVHSDSADPAEAALEETEYRSRQVGGWSPLAAALAAIGGNDIRTTLLREEAPLETHASARFGSLASMFDGYCTAARLLCHSKIEHDGTRTTWTLTAPTDGDGEDNEVVGALDEALSELRIVLGSGRFVSARGFKLTGSRVAELDWIDDADTFSLTWDVAETSGK